MVSGTLGIRLLLRVVEGEGGAGASGWPEAAAAGVWQGHQWARPGAADAAQTGEPGPAAGAGDRAQAEQDDQGLTRRSQTGGGRGACVCVCYLCVCVRACGVVCVC